MVVVNRIFGDERPPAAAPPPQSTTEDLTDGLVMKAPRARKPRAPPKFDMAAELLMSGGREREVKLNNGGFVANNDDGSDAERLMQRLKALWNGSVTQPMHPTVGAWKYRSFRPFFPWVLYHIAHVPFIMFRETYVPFKMCHLSQWFLPPTFHIVPKVSSTCWYSPQLCCLLLVQTGRWSCRLAPRHQLVLGRYNDKSDSWSDCELSRATCTILLRRSLAL